MEKMIYAKPQIEIFATDVTDIIVTSGGEETGGDEPDK